MLHPSRHVVALLVVFLIGGCGSATSSPAVPAASTARAVEPSPRSPDAAPRPIIVDVDLDASDVVALAVLLRDPELDIRAILISSTGLVHCNAGLRNTSYILEQLGVSDIPVACGRDDAGPDGHPFPDDWRTAVDRAWGMDIHPLAVTTAPQSAATVFARAITESPEPPIVIALGPWTNLEDAFAADPSLSGRIAAIHAMAGTIDAPGNVVIDDITDEDRLEWNVAADPSAVAAVLATIVPINLVPLDATEDVPVPTDLVDRLASDHAAAGADLAYELLVRFPGRMTDPGQQLWDELAALTVTRPDLVTWEDIDIVIATDGRLDRTANGRQMRVAMAADRAATEAALLAALRTGQARTDPFVIGN